MDKLLSPKELAEYLGLPVGTVYAWNYRGAGPKPITVRRHVRYRESDIQKWLDQQTSAPPLEAATPKPGKALARAR
jgi:excisionase family DNA binding protein